MPDSIVILLVFGGILVMCGISAYIAEHFHNGDSRND